MLFTFKYISHNIETLHLYIEFLFKEVWMKADGDFEADKLIATDQFNDPKELYQIYVDLGNSESDWADFFNSSIENIYKAFLELTDEYKAELLTAFETNNNIELLCNDRTLQPTTYEDIELVNADLAKLFKDFYGKLYGTSSPFNLKIFGFLNKKLIGDYDKAFMDNNSKGICPFCGLTHLKGNNHSYREAYDHFIPKGIYPFNSINFENLAPMCNECNSTYKLTKIPLYTLDYKLIDPLNKAANRSLAFYPYAKNHPEIEFQIKLFTKDIINLKPDEIRLDSFSENHSEQIETWFRVFGIEERYKALLCNTEEGITWFKSIFEEFENAKKLSEIDDAKKFLETNIKISKRHPLSSYGFLKSVFLEECNSKGLFKNINKLSENIS